MSDMPTDRREKEVGIYRRSNERGIFGNSPSPEARFIEDKEHLSRYVEAIKELGLSVVLTSGTFDMPHIGHARYLEAARSFGDVLVVGVDSDEKVRNRKGPDRPVVPHIERVEFLTHLRSVDIVTLKGPDEPKWDLIKRVRPDTLIITQETYDEGTRKQLEEYCGQVECLPPQASTSTSNQLRKLHIGWSGEITQPIDEMLAEGGASEELRKKIGRFLNGGRLKRE